MAGQKSPTAVGTLIYTNRSPPPLACIATAALKNLRLDRKPTSEMAKEDAPIIKLSSGWVYTTMTFRAGTMREEYVRQDWCQWASAYMLTLLVSS